MITNDQIETAAPDDVEQSPFSPGYHEPDYTNFADVRPVRVCAEPMPMSAAIAGSGVLLQGIASTDGRAHPFDGKCKVCDKQLEHLWRQLDPKLAPGWFPITCCDPCYEEAKVDQARLKHNREMWERICPTEFRADWDNTKGGAALFKRVMDWAAKWVPAKKIQPELGLVIHGDSSSCKTRVAWQLYRRLCEEGVSVLFAEAVDIVDEVPKEAFTVGVLIIDDLGNDAMDFKKEQRLLKLLRSRAQWHRPFVVTTQYGGADLVARFKQESTGEAVVRRLREFCEPIQARRIPTAITRADINAQTGGAR